MDIGAIERELTSLWQAASADESSGVIRSSTLNLLVYAPADSDLRALDDIVADITAAHPCRAVVMIVDAQGQTPSISAEVTSLCRLSPGDSGKQVCCEQVTVNASGSQIGEVPSAIAPLLIPDLPVYLWWRAVPRLEDKALFRKLTEISDRVVIDSAQFGDPVVQINNLAAILKTTPSWAAVSDVNWARLTAWRGLLAGFYDVAEYRPLLEQLSRVVIEHSLPEGTDAPISARALLLGGWLASRLGWRLSDQRSGEGVHDFIFEAQEARVTLEFRATERQIEPGRLSKVVFESAADQSALFSVRRSTDSMRLETAVVMGQENRSQRVLSYENLSEAALISRELQIFGNDRVYEQAVLGAASLATHL